MENVRLCLEQRFFQRIQREIVYAGDLDTTGIHCIGQGGLDAIQLHIDCQLMVIRGRGACQQHAYGTLDGAGKGWNRSFDVAHKWRAWILGKEGFSVRIVEEFPRHLGAVDIGTANAKADAFVAGGCQTCLPCLPDGVGQYLERKFGTDCPQLGIILSRQLGERQ